MGTSESLKAAIQNSIARQVEIYRHLDDQGRGYEGLKIRLDRDALKTENEFLKSVLLSVLNGGEIDEKTTEMLGQYFEKMDKTERAMFQGCVLDICKAAFDLSR